MEITIDIRAIGKESVRVNNRFASIPIKTRNYMDIIKNEIFYRLKPIISNNPFSVIIEASFKSTISPDCDNIAKAILDAMTGIVWKDDRQVLDLRIIKHLNSEDRLKIIYNEINRR